MIDIDGQRATRYANTTRFRAGILVARRNGMDIVCRHCDETIIGQPYRVISEEDGVVLLNMIVCAACAEVAKGLLLRTEKIAPDHKAPPAPASDIFDLLLDSFKDLRLCSS